MREDFENPFGIMAGGKPRTMSSLLDSAVFPGTQGGPLEHVIAAKAVAFGEALRPEWKEYAMQVKANAAAMAQELTKLGYQIVSGGTDNHSMLIDLRNKGITGKAAEAALGLAGITVNKNMVPFDEESPFVTSGIRLGTSAISTRGLKEEDSREIARTLHGVLEDPSWADSARERISEMMSQRPLFAW